MSSTAATGMPKLDTGPQKSARKYQIDCQECCDEIRQGGLAEVPGELEEGRLGLGLSTAVCAD